MDDQNRKLSPAEVAVHRQRMLKILKEQDEVKKAQHLLNLKQAQADNPIKPKPRKKRGRKRR